MVQGQTQRDRRDMFTNEQNCAGTVTHNQTVKNHNHEVLTGIPNHACPGVSVIRFGILGAQFSGQVTLNRVPDNLIELIIAEEPATAIEMAPPHGACITSSSVVSRSVSVVPAQRPLMTGSAFLST